jgi:hypothetical protein
MKTGQFGGGVPSGKPLGTVPHGSWKVCAPVVPHLSRESHVLTSVSSFLMQPYPSSGNQPADRISFMRVVVGRLSGANQGDTSPRLVPELSSPESVV